jgi:hypothetical protein
MYSYLLVSYVFIYKIFLCYFIKYSYTVLLDRVSYFGLWYGRLYRGSPVIADESQIVRRLPPNVRRKQLIVARICAKENGIFVDFL